MNLRTLALFYLRMAGESDDGSLWLTMPTAATAKIELQFGSTTLKCLLELQRAGLLETQPSGEHVNVLKWTITALGIQCLKDPVRMQFPTPQAAVPTPVRPTVPSRASVERLMRLTYMSRPTPLARQPSPSEAKLQLGEQARRLNREQGLTGALLVGSEFFIQVLEGEREPLINTLGRINHDARHRDVRIFELTEAKERLFSNWAMHLGAVDQVDPELIWQCVESFKKPNPARAGSLVEALTQSVQAAA
jgi:hypothetical protein